MAYHNQHQQGPYAYASAASSSSSPHLYSSAGAAAAQHHPHYADSQQHYAQPHAAAPHQIAHYGSPQAAPQPQQPQAPQYDQSAAVDPAAGVPEWQAQMYSQYMQAARAQWFSQAQNMPAPYIQPPMQAPLKYQPSALPSQRTFENVSNVQPHREIVINPSSHSSSSGSNHGNGRSRRDDRDDRDRRDREREYEREQERRREQDEINQREREREQQPERKVRMVTVKLKPQPAEELSAAAPAVAAAAMEPARPSPSSSAHSLRAAPGAAPPPGKRSSGQLDYAHFPIQGRREASYIVFKSLDHHDIGISQEQGIWATLPKNKTKVNQLFDHSTILYAFYSVNGSGRFEGYARVVCGVGRELTDTEWLTADGKSTWGEVFKVEWICTNPLPFASLPNDLVNSINDGKPVKVAFDGTELDARCGERLKAIMDGAGGKEGAGSRGGGGGGAGVKFEQQGAGGKKKPPRGAKPEPYARPAAAASSASTSASSYAAAASKSPRPAYAASSTDGQPRAPPPRSSPAPAAAAAASSSSSPPAPQTQAMPDASQAIQSQEPSQADASMQ